MNISELQLDILREIVNIGAGNASNALSVITGKKVLITVPGVTRVPVHAIEDFLPTAPAVILHSSFTGGINLEGLFVVYPENAAKLVEQLTGQSINTEQLSEHLASDDEQNIIRSALLEICNILAGAFANAVSEMISEPVITSVPLLAFEYLESAVDAVVAAACQNTDDIFVFNTSIASDDQAAALDFFLIPTDGAEKLILEKV